MDRMKIQELALVRMIRMGELEKRTNSADITIWHSMPEKKQKKRKVIPQMEVKQGFE